LGLPHGGLFLDDYLNPAINAEFIGLNVFEMPTLPLQNYPLTSKGVELKERKNKKGEK